MEPRSVKAMLREVAKSSGWTSRKENRGSVQIFQHHLHPKGEDGGDKIWLNKQEPDGRIERPVHAMTPMGPRTSLKAVDFIAPGTRITFRLLVLPGKIGQKELAHLLALAQETGWGADRSQQFGKFKVVALTKEA